MENTSKALLIAAAILIAILLISFGMKILNSTEGTLSSAESTGEAISSSTSSAKAQVVLSMIDIHDEASFSGYLKKEYAEKTLSAAQVRELCQIVIERTKKISDGSIYLAEKTHITSNPNFAVHYTGFNTNTIQYDLSDNEKYSVVFDGSTNITNTYSIKIRAIPSTN